jgi:hypothetical protein
MLNTGRRSITAKVSSGRIGSKASLEGYRKNGTVSFSDFFVL